MIAATELRVFVYDWLLARGLPPASAEIARHFGTDAASARQALATLNIGKAVLPDPRTGEIWMAGPFASTPSAYKVKGRNTQWFANCAWDMLGIAVIASQPVRVETHCTDCHSPMIIDVDPVAGPNVDAVVHFLVPARDWYRDIGYT